MDEPQHRDEPPPAQAGRLENHKNGKRSFWKRRPVVVLGTVALACVFFWGLRELARSFTHESTDNAFLASDIVSIAPRVSGQVKAVYVSDNEPVKAGDPLVEIDPSDYQVALAQKKAAQAAAEANAAVIKASFQMLTTQVASAQDTAKQSEATAAADQAKAEKAAADLKRAEDLFHRKIISPQEYDAAKSGADAAKATYNSSQARAAADRSKVAGAEAELQAGRKAYDRAVALADQSRVDVRQADLNLSYTRLVAPQDGLVTRKAVEQGDYVEIGQKLMALVVTDLWVTANFKETQLKKIRVGQPVSVSIDSVAGKVFPARVESIQAGSGAAFSLLPPENAVGNYVKVVQRVPVKIVFTAPVAAGHVVGPGMSVEPSVQVGGIEVPTPVVAAVALALAIIVGIFWWRYAGRQESQR